MNPSSKRVQYARRTPRSGCPIRELYAGAASPHALGAPRTQAREPAGVRSRRAQWASVRVFARGVSDAGVLFRVPRSPFAHRPVGSPPSRTISYHRSTR